MQTLQNVHQRGGIHLMLYLFGHLRSFGSAALLKVLHRIVVQPVTYPCSCSLDLVVHLDLVGHFKPVPQPECFNVL